MTKRWTESLSSPLALLTHSVLDRGVASQAPRRSESMQDFWHTIGHVETFIRDGTPLRAHHVRARNVRGMVVRAASVRQGALLARVC